MLNPRIDQKATRSRLWSRLAVGAFIVIMSLAISTGTAFSQDDQGAPPPQGSEMGGHGGHHQMPSVDEQLKHMTKKLDLSDDQQTKVKAILEDQHAKMEALHNDSSMAREDKFGKMREIHENSSTQIKALLNEDQQKKFDKMQEEQREHMGRQGPPPQSN